MPCNGLTHGSPAPCHAWRDDVVKREHSLGAGSCIYDPQTLTRSPRATMPLLGALCQPDVQQLSPLRLGMLLRRTWAVNPLERGLAPTALALGN